MAQRHPTATSPDPRDPNHGAVASGSGPSVRASTDASRAEWIAGAEEEWRKRIGRPMTSEELDRVLRRHPGHA